MAHDMGAATTGPYVVAADLCLAAGRVPGGRLRGWTAPPHRGRPNSHHRRSVSQILCASFASIRFGSAPHAISPTP
eukprot:1576974-Prymnesium_polylepis.2